MLTTIIIFYVSFAIIISMILLKRHEVKSRQPTIISRLGRGSDHIFHAIFGAVKKTFSYANKHTFVALGHWMAFHVLLHTRKVYVEVKSRAIASPQGKKMLDAVRGRGEVKNHGASFYLRRISEK